MMTPKLIEAVNRAVAQAFQAGFTHGVKPMRTKAEDLAAVQNYGRALVQKALEAGDATP